MCCEYMCVVMLLMIVSIVCIGSAIRIMIRGNYSMCCDVLCYYRHDD